MSFEENIFPDCEGYPEVFTEITHRFQKDLRADVPKNHLLLESIDLFELALKFHGSVILSDYFQRVKNASVGEVPEKIIEEVLSPISRPALGHWMGFTRVLLKEFNREGQSTFIKEFKSFDAALKRKGPFPETLEVDGIKMENAGDFFLKLRNKYKGHGALADDETSRKPLETVLPLISDLYRRMVYLKDYGLEADAEGKVQLVRNDSAVISLTPLIEYEENGFVFFNEKDHARSTLHKLSYRTGRHSWDSRFYALFEKLFPPRKRMEEERIDRSLIDRLTSNFVGRENDLYRIFAFTDSYRNGYLCVEGRPGIGKSALLAQLFRLSDEVALDKESTEGFAPLRDKAKSFYALHLAFRRNDASQLETLADASRLIIGQLRKKMRSSMPPVDNKLPIGTLQNALRIASEDVLRKEKKKLLILIDGLDEVRDSGLLDIVSLGELPADVYVICAKRTGTLLWLHERFDPEQTVFYRLNGLERPSIVSILWTVFPRSEIGEEAAEVVLERSEGNPLYLHLLCESVKNGELSGNELHDLPGGIERFLEQAIELYGGDGRMLRVLSVARGFIPKRIAASLADVPQFRQESVFRETAPLLEASEDKVRLFHASLYDMLENKFGSEMPKIHRSVVKKIEEWDLRDSEELNYYLEHMSEHRFYAGELKKLIDTNADMQKRMLEARRVDLLTPHVRLVVEACTRKYELSEMWKAVRNHWKTEPIRSRVRVQMLKSIDVSSGAVNVLRFADELDDREKLRYLLSASAAMALNGVEFTQVHRLLRSASEIRIHDLNVFSRESVLVEATLLFLIRAYTDERSLEYLSALAERMQLGIDQAEKLINFLEKRPFSNTGDFSHLISVLFSTADVSSREDVIIESLERFCVGGEKTYGEAEYVLTFSENELETMKRGLEELKKPAPFIVVAKAADYGGFGNIRRRSLSEAVKFSRRDINSEEPEWIEELVFLSNGDEEVLFSFADYLCEEGVEPRAVRRFLEASLNAANMPLSVGRRLKERVSFLRFSEGHDEQAALLVKTMIASGHQEECRKWTVSTETELAYESIIELLRDGALKVDEIKPFNIMFDYESEPEDGKPVITEPDTEGALRYWISLLKKGRDRLQHNKLEMLAKRIVESEWWNTEHLMNKMPDIIQVVLSSFTICGIDSRDVWCRVLETFPKPDKIISNEEVTDELLIEVNTGVLVKLYASIFLAEQDELLKKLLPEIDERWPVLGKKWSVDMFTLPNYHPACDILEQMARMGNGPALFRGFEKVLPLIPEEESSLIEPWVWLQGVIAAADAHRSDRAWWYLQKVRQRCEFSNREEKGVEPPLLPLIGLILSTDENSIQNEVLDIITQYISQESLSWYGREYSVEDLRFIELITLGFEDFVVRLIKSISDMKTERYRLVQSLLHRLDNLDFDGRTIDIFSYLTHVKYFHGPTHAIHAAARHDNWQLVEELLGLSVEDLFMKNESEEFKGIKVGLCEEKEIGGMDDARERWSQWKLTLILPEVLSYEPAVKVLHQVLPDLAANQSKLPKEFLEWLIGKEKKDLKERVQLIEPYFTIDWKSVAEQLIGAGRYTEAIELIENEGIAELASPVLRNMPDSLRNKYERTLLALLKNDVKGLAFAGGRIILTELAEKVSKTPRQLKENDELLAEIVLNLVQRGLGQKAITLVAETMVDEENSEEERARRELVVLSSLLEAAAVSDEETASKCAREAMKIVHVQGERIDPVPIAQSVTKLFLFLLSRRLWDEAYELANWISDVYLLFLAVAALYDGGGESAIKALRNLFDSYAERNKLEAINGVVERLNINLLKDLFTSIHFPTVEAGTDFAAIARDYPSETVELIGALIEKFSSTAEEVRSFLESFHEEANSIRWVDEKYTVFVQEICSRLFRGFVPEQMVRLFDARIEQLLENGVEPENIEKCVEDRAQQGQGRSLGRVAEYLLDYFEEDTDGKWGERRVGEVIKIFSSIAVSLVCAGENKAAASLYRKALSLVMQDKRESGLIIGAFIRYPVPVKDIIEEMRHYLDRVDDREGVEELLQGVDSGILPKTYEKFIEWYVHNGDIPDYDRVETVTTVLLTRYLKAGKFDRATEALDNLKVSQMEKDKLNYGRMQIALYAALAGDTDFLKEQFEKIEPGFRLYGETDSLLPESLKQAQAELWSTFFNVIFSHIDHLGSIEHRRELIGDLFDGLGESGIVEPYLWSRLFEEASRIAGSGAWLMQREEAEYHSWGKGFTSFLDLNIGDAGVLNAVNSFVEACYPVSQRDYSRAGLIMYLTGQGRLDEALRQAGLIRQQAALHYVIRYLVKPLAERAAVKETYIAELGKIMGKTATELDGDVFFNVTFPQLMSNWGPHRQEKIKGIAMVLGILPQKQLSDEKEYFDEKDLPEQAHNALKPFMESLEKGDLSREEYEMARGMILGKYG